MADIITKSGGKAAINTNSFLEGAKIIDAAVAAFGGVHILINAAEFPAKPKTFEQITDAEWAASSQFYIKGNFLVCIQVQCNSERGS